MVPLMDAMTASWGASAEDPYADHESDDQDHESDPDEGAHDEPAHDEPAHDEPFACDEQALTDDDDEKGEGNERAVDFAEPAKGWTVESPPPPDTSSEHLQKMICRLQHLQIPGCNKAIVFNTTNLNGVVLDEGVNQCV